MYISRDVSARARARMSVPWHAADQYVASMHFSLKLESYFCKLEE